MNYLLVYYDEITGEALVIRYYYNDVMTDSTPADDFAAYPELRGGRGIGCVFVELTEELAAAMDGAKISVDIMAEPPELVFTPYEAMEDQEAQQAD